GGGGRAAGGPARRHDRWLRGARTVDGGRRVLSRRSGSSRRLGTRGRGLRAAVAALQRHSRCRRRGCHGSGRAPAARVPRGVARHRNRRPSVARARPTRVGNAARRRGARTDLHRHLPRPRRRGQRARAAGGAARHRRGAGGGATGRPCRVLGASRHRGPPSARYRDARTWKLIGPPTERSPVKRVLLISIAAATALTVVAVSFGATSLKLSTVPPAQLKYNKKALVAKAG